MSPAPQRRGVRTFQTLGRSDGQVVAAEDCVICGAMVPEHRTEDHRRWHERVAAYLDDER